MDPKDHYDAQQMLLDDQGGEAPSEWDAELYPIRYKTVVGLKRSVKLNKPSKSTKGKAGGAGAAGGDGAAGGAGAEEGADGLLSLE